MAKAYVKHDYAVTGRDYVETDGGDTPGGGVDYSTEEQDTGIKWLNGSPIYVKSFTELSVETNGTTWVTLAAIDGLSMVLSVDAYASGGQKVAVAETMANENNVRLSVVSSGFNRTIATATVYYTKVS